MRLHRFYISEQIGNRVALTVDSSELVNQIRRVFRLKEGDRIKIFDGSGFDYLCTIGNNKDSLTLSIVGSEKSRFMPGRDLVLCAAVVKKDIFEWIVEKATELGVSRVIPIIAERSEKKALNIERLEKIAIEASEQSGRGDVPTIGQIQSIEEAFGSFEENRIAFHTEAEAFKSAAWKVVGDNGEVSTAVKRPSAVFIGPEGGWSSAEIGLFQKNEVPIYCLGPQVLRAETAAIAVLSQLAFD